MDTVGNFHGLERLIVIPVGLDEVGSDKGTIQSRARLYCAMTRAQLFVVVVNEFLRGGCLEFLGHVELREDHGTIDKTEVDSEAAGALMVRKKKMMEGKRANAEGVGEVSGSATAEPSSAEASSAAEEPSFAEERQAGGADPTESQVRFQRPPVREG